MKESEYNENLEPDKGLDRETYKFPTRKQRLQLLEELRELEKTEGAQYTNNDIYQRYVNAFSEMNKEMERLSTPEKKDLEHPITFVPAMTKEDRDKLLALMVEVGKAGEMFLAQIQNQKKSLAHGIPGVVNKLQGIMAKDFDTISEYDPETKQTLPELQEKARTRTINLSGETLITVGNMQSSRIPMAVTTSRGETRNGVFTKANYNTVKSDFNKMLEKAAEYSGAEGKKEIANLLSTYRNTLIEDQATKRDGTFIDDHTPDDYLIGYLRRKLDSKYGKQDSISSGQMKKYLRDIMGVDTRKLSSKSISTLASGMTTLMDNVGAEISNYNLELTEGDRVDTRNSAMSAVAGLLGVSNLIAKSENMNYVDDNGNVIEGTFMAFGKGLDPYEHPEHFAHFATDPFKKKGQILKQMADLQILDFLCLNVDRHAGNLMYQVDAEGNLTGIQGIDNDSSFGTRSITAKDIARLRVVSKSMVDKINSISPEMLKFTLRGRGLSEKEMDKAAERLELLKQKIEAKRIKVVEDKDFRHLQFKSLKPPKNSDNMFSFVKEFLEEGITDIRKAGLGFVPYEGNEDPQLKIIASTERKGTVGGVEDTFRRLTVYDLRNQDGLVSKVRGQSEQFKELLEATNLAKQLFVQLVSNDEIDKKAMLTEIDARPILKASSNNMKKVMEKAEAYLQFKMEEKKVDSLDKLKGKNSYEQKHIDYAKRMLEFVEEYNAHLEGPTNDREREEAMTNYENRHIDMKRQALEKPKPKKEAPNVDEFIKEHESFLKKGQMAKGK